MRYQTKFESYIPESDWTSDDYHYYDKLMDKIWDKICESHPDNPDLCDKIYEQVKHDFLSNYNYICEVKVTIKHKK